MMSEYTRWGRIKDRTVSWGVAVLAVIAFFSIVGNVFQDRTIVNLSQQNLNSQNAHHAATIKKDKELQEALNTANIAITELKASAAAIQYEGGVIAYQNGEIIAAQQAGHATLAAITGLEMQLTQAEGSVGATLVGGQTQINAYLKYLTCLGTNQSNVAVCGSAPALPAT